MKGRLVTNVLASCFAWADRNGLACQVALLAAVSGLAAAMLAAVAWLFVGAAGVAAAAVAWSLCLAGAVATLACTELFPHAHRAMVGVAMGFVVRQAFPLFVGVALSLKSHYLADGGLPLMLVPLYMVTLAVDAAFLVSQVSKVSPNASVGAR